MASAYVPPLSACPYAVVEVINDSTKEGTVFPVASKWLSNVAHAFDSDGKYGLSAMISCPSNEDAYTEMLMKRATPEDSPAWVKAPGKVLQFFRTLGSAKNGAERAEYESNIESDGPIKKTKRQRKPPARFLEDDSESEEEVSKERKRRALFERDDSESEEDATKEPVQSKQGKEGGVKAYRFLLSSRKQGSQEDKNGGTSSTSSRPNDAEEIDADATPDDDNGSTKDVLVDAESMENTEGLPPVDKTNELPPSCSSAAGSQQLKLLGEGSSASVVSPPIVALPPQPLLEKVETPKKVVQQKPSKKLQFPLGKNSPSKNLRSPVKASSATAKPSYGYTSGGVSALTFAREMKILNEKLDSMSIKLSALYMHVVPSVSSKEKNKEKSIIPNLPVASNEELAVLQQFVEEGLEQEVGIVNILSEYGGSTLKDAVFGIMKHLLSNDVARFYNMEGINRKGSAVTKVGIRDTFLHELIHAAVKKRIAKLTRQRKIDITFDPEVVDGYISGWLKDAPQRFLNEGKKSAARQSKKAALQADPAQADEDDPPTAA